VRTPRPRGTPIDGRRYRRWVDRFGSYKDGVTNTTIDNWFEQFEVNDKDLAARILDAVNYYGQTQILASYKQAVGAFTGWHPDPNRRQGKWCFAAMSTSAGESGDAMLYQFRLASGLDSKAFHDIFVNRSELFRRTLLSPADPKQLGANDTVVLLDDFSGTGKQVCDAWNDPQTSFGALLAGVGRVYLVLVAASRAARERITRDTSMTLVSAHELREADNVFSPSCTHFSDPERQQLIHYGRRADKKNPKGFGECGLLVVFQHRAPNNTIPILHADNERWTGLFPRHQ
jgi:hypothetical protein